MSRINIFSPAAAGSIGHGFIYALNLCNYLKNGEIELFTLYKPDIIKKFKESGIKVNYSHRFSPGSIDKKRFNRYGYFKEIIYGFYRIYYNYSLLKEFYCLKINAEVYHLLEFEYISTILFFLTRKKILKRTIIGLHSIDFKWISGRSVIVNIYKKLLRFLMPLLIKNAKYVTVHGEFLKEELIKEFKLDKDFNKIKNINYGCNIKSYKDELKYKLRKKYNVNENIILGLFFGVIRSDKGLIELLKKFPEISGNVSLLIAGSEGDIKKNEIEKIILKKGIYDRVICKIKYIEEEEIADYFYLSDFVFITHKNFHVAFSGPLILAVEYYRPVIASDVGEIGYFVRKNKNGILYECNNWSDMVLKTNEFISNIKLWDTFDFSHVQKRNSWQKMAENIKILYH